MKAKITILLFSLILIPYAYAQDSANNEDTPVSLSKEELKGIMEKYLAMSNKVFGSGSTVDDVDSLYSFYTDDFEYNHPKYGGVYSRELLYGNTIRYLKKGSYNDSPRRLTLNMIVGLDAVVIEQRYEDADETTMTLFRFRNDKIYYIEEYW